MAAIDEDDRAPAPYWSTCTHRIGETDSPCIGSQVGFGRCLAHLESEQLEEFLQWFGPGADLDARGTNIDAALMARIFRAVASEKGPPTFGVVDLEQACFIEEVSFTGVRFSGDAWFDRARFSGDARFDRAQFRKDTDFAGARFNGDARFDRARFRKDARFGGAQFSQDARFDRAQFSGHAWFDRARFRKDARFGGAQFSQDARFRRAEFGGHAQFDSALFSSYANFDDAQFSGYANFGDATINEEALFNRAVFSGDTWFRGAQFSGCAQFSGVQFSDNAHFARARFSGHADFDDAQFSGHTAQFDQALFSGDARFSGAQFWDASFPDARFEKVTSLGPLAAGHLILQRAVFVERVVVEAVAGFVTCTDTTWNAGVTMRLRHARLDLERATFTVPSFVSGADKPFELSVSSCLDEGKVLNVIRGERHASGDLWVPVLLSLRSADASNLSVTDVDLSQCRFAGARLLDQLRLEGRCIFDHPPKGSGRAGRGHRYGGGAAGSAWPRNASGGPRHPNHRAGLPADPTNLPKSIQND
jgi:hypothetical protein